MNSLPNYRGYRFPPEIISHTVWLYHRFTLSLRDIEDLLAERNVIVSYESIRQWCERFGLEYAKRLQKKRGPGGDRWFLDEVTVSQGKRQYLWRAVDQDGDLLDILVQSRKDKRAAESDSRCTSLFRARAERVGGNDHKRRSVKQFAKSVLQSLTGMFCENFDAGRFAAIADPRTGNAGRCHDGRPVQVECPVHRLRPIAAAGNGY